jgi:hypothetical protein
MRRGRPQLWTAARILPAGGRKEGVTAITDGSQSPLSRCREPAAEPRFGALGRRANHCRGLTQTIWFCVRGAEWPMMFTAAAGSIGGHRRSTARCCVASLPVETQDGLLRAPTRAPAGADQVYSSVTRAGASCRCFPRASLSRSWSPRQWRPCGRSRNAPNLPARRALILLGPGLGQVARADTRHLRVEVSAGRRCPVSAPGFALVGWRAVPGRRR